MPELARAINNDQPQVTVGLRCQRAVLRPLFTSATSRPFTGGSRGSGVLRRPDASDVATLWWLCGRLEEDGVDCFVIEHGRQRVNPLAELPGWKTSLERLTEARLLSRDQQRGRTEYRLGANAVRMIEAAALQRTLPFARIEDLDTAKLT